MRPLCKDDSFPTLIPIATRHFYLPRKFFHRRDSYVLDDNCIHFYFNRSCYPD